jgi:hypothetical protein
MSRSAGRQHRLGIEEVLQAEHQAAQGPKGSRVKGPALRSFRQTGRVRPHGNQVIAAAAATNATTISTAVYPSN